MILRVLLLIVLISEIANGQLLSRPGPPYHQSEQVKLPLVTGNMLRTLYKTLSENLVSERNYPQENYPQKRNPIYEAAVNFQFSNSRENSPETHRPPVAYQAAEQFASITPGHRGQNILQQHGVEIAHVFFPKARTGSIQRPMANVLVKYLGPNSHTHKKYKEEVLKTQQQLSQYSEPQVMNIVPVYLPPQQPQVQVQPQPQPAVRNELIQQYSQQAQQMLQSPSMTSQQLLQNPNPSFGQQFMQSPPIASQQMLQSASLTDPHLLQNPNPSFGQQFMQSQPIPSQQMLQSPSITNPQLLQNPNPSLGQQFMQSQPIASQQILHNPSFTQQVLQNPTPSSGGQSLQTPSFTQQQSPQTQSVNQQLLQSPSLNEQWLQNPSPTFTQQLLQNPNPSFSKQLQNNPSLTQQLLQIPSVREQLLQSLVLGQPQNPSPINLTKQLNPSPSQPEITHIQENDKDSHSPQQEKQSSKYKFFADLKYPESKRPYKNKKTRPTPTHITFTGPDFSHYLKTYLNNLKSKSNSNNSKPTTYKYKSQNTKGKSQKSQAGVFIIKVDLDRLNAVRQEVKKGTGLVVARGVRLGGELAHAGKGIAAKAMKYASSLQTN